MKDNASYPSGRRKRYIWSLLFFVIAALSVWAVTKQAKDFTPKKFFEYLNSNNPWWLAAAALAMASYITFDALMIRTLLKDFGHGRGFSKCLTYASSDIYFSAITPSGTGGQPMEAFFMYMDGVSAAISTAVVMIYLFFYTVSIVIVGLLCLVLVPGSFTAFGSLGRFLIIIGAVIQSVLALFYGMILWKEKLLLKICDGTLRFLAKIRILKNIDARREKLARLMEQYSYATSLIKGRRKLLLKTLLFNLAHRISQIMVTVFCYLAGGGSLGKAPFMFAMQSNVVIGSCCVPTPGSMGVADYMMINGFNSIMSSGQSANLELLSRTISFYICILLCGAIVLVKLGMIRVRKKKSNTGEAVPEQVAEDGNGTARGESAE